MKIREGQKLSRNPKRMNSLDFVISTGTKVLKCIAFIIETLGQFSQLSSATRVLFKLICGNRLKEPSMNFLLHFDDILMSHLSQCEQPVPNVQIVGKSANWETSEKTPSVYFSRLFSLAVLHAVALFFAPFPNI